MLIINSTTCLPIFSLLITRIRSFLPLFFFFNDTAPTEIYTLPLHDALPISSVGSSGASGPSLTAGDKGRGPRSPARIVLDAGEQLVISPTAPPNILRVNVERATAWQNGELVFENEPLSNVVARVNRYGAHPIVIDDDPTASMRISGVFH